MTSKLHLFPVLVGVYFILMTSSDSLEIEKYAIKESPKMYLQRSNKDIQIYIVCRILDSLDKASVSFLSKRGWIYHRTREPSDLMSIVKTGNYGGDVRTDLRKLLENYSKYMFVDFVFEVLKVLLLFIWTAVVQVLDSN